MTELLVPIQKEQGLLPLTNLYGDFTIKKHSSLVQASSGSSLMQRKLLDAMLLITKDFLKCNPEQRIFQQELWLLARISGIGETNTAYIKRGLRALKKTDFDYNVLGKDKEHWGSFSILADIDVTLIKNGKRSFVTREYPTRVLNAIADPSIYRIIDLLISRDITSKYAHIIYQLLLDYINVGWVRIEYQHLRQLLNIPSNKYAHGFNMFKRKVLDKSVTVINEKTDIIISYEVERAGLKVMAITFNVGRKGGAPDSKEVIDNKLLKKLQYYGFKEKQAKFYLKAHEAKYIAANIEVMEKALAAWKSIRSTAAYLSAAFRDDYRPLETEHSRQQQEQAIKKESIQSEQAEDETQRQAKNEEEEHRLYALLEKKISELSMEQEEEYKAQFIASVQKQGLSTVYKKLQEEDEFDNTVVKGVWKIFLRQKLINKSNLN